ncbi:ABR232Cp [Eremothecium gossypii ATCC 10895]|uniref:Regulator of free ubiquitin chains 1 n=1 Tax=Eremothecium gossypii (strain ATCC 10895 / CBS 109.51 / FGSC 9923 / NRRL Y-1056) TaxID=284811 RepID=RFU1_EREGS|nr:ABR232Cp [Eremothecium gossypii ATCC 10895]Q75CZ0.2 RecName: Full=Regulator of free ubiquitin chains 1 [Eremothecium gossypii ATCC 10895]AAS51005.2 ABR232Cp [Eremothecium gossypii ATCC 10895]AEY95294.1 FABR232Cp [Eremothecium gossypii FDAG1]
MKSSAQLCMEARNYNFNAAAPLRLYLATCVRLVEEAQAAAQADDVARAYMLYVRYLDLCMHQLSGHREVQQPVTDAERLSRDEYEQLLRLEVPAVLRLTEELKSAVDLRHERGRASLARSVVPEAGRGEHSRQEVQLPPSFDEERFNRTVQWFLAAGRSMSLPVSAEEPAVREVFSYPELPKLSMAAESWAPS